MHDLMLSLSTAPTLSSSRIPREPGEPRLGSDQLRPRNCGIASHKSCPLPIAGKGRPCGWFERANRAFFAARVGDRGDDFFEYFDDHLGSRVHENREGTSLFFVMVDTDGEVLGRVNISDIDHPGLTELGFRVAEHVQGCGIATRGVIAALDIAARRGVKILQARVSTANLASRRVLQRCGFVQSGQAQAPDGSSELFIGYRKELVGPSASPSIDPS